MKPCEREFMKEIERAKKDPYKYELPEGVEWMMEDRGKPHIWDDVFIASDAVENYCKKKEGEKKKSPFGPQSTKGPFGPKGKKY